MCRSTLMIVVIGLTGTQSSSNSILSLHLISEVVCFIIGICELRKNSTVL